MTQSADPNRRPSASSRLGRWEARDVAPWVSLAVLVIFFSFASPSFARVSTLTAILKQGSVLAIVAAGLTFVLISAEIDLAAEMMALLSAGLCGWLFVRWAGAESAPAWAIPIVIAAPLASCLALGLLAGLLTVWTRLPSFIITLAMWFIAEGMARCLTQSQTFVMPGVLQDLGNESLKLGAWLGLPEGASRFLEIPYNAILAGAVLLVSHVVLEHTRFGRYVYMTGGNREAARLAGVRTGRIVVACLAISGLAAGLAGLVNAGRLTNFTLDQNKGLLLSAVACVVLGGTSLFGGEGSISKTIVGVLTFMVLNVGLIQIHWINDLSRQLVTGLVLMGALVVNGILSRRR
jgi:ribose transport system permease protein